jgi:energy-coupling factor transport system permease protein
MRITVALGRYIARGSVIHRLDARVKINCMLALIALAFVASGFVGLGLLFATVAAVVVLARIRPSELLRALGPLLLLLVFPLIFNVVLVTDGNLLFRVGPLAVSDEGVRRALYMTLRLFILFAAGTLLTLTTTNIELCDATAAMLRPFERFGLPAFEIAMMVSIALRFVPLLLETYERIYKSLLARGARLGRGGPIARAKALSPVLTALFASAFRQSEELGIAMESRCYNGAKRTHYRQPAIGRRDYIASASILILTVALIVLRLVGL